MIRSLFALLLLAFASIAPAADEPAKLKDAISQTDHTITLDSKKIDYQATAGTMVLKDEDGKPQASIFYMAYIKTDEDAAKRPLTFCFNGGPGSSSVWLHMGAFGPRRVNFSDEGQPLPPPAKLIDNEGSILDLTDLVFIDPVSTGFSRAADEKNAKQFHGVFRKTCNPSANSSGSTPRRRGVGSRRSTLPAKATAPRGPPRLRTTSRANSA